MKLEDLEPRSRAGHPTERDLEVLAFEPERAPRATREHVAACEECRALADALDAQRDAFLCEQPTAMFLRKIAPRPARTWALIPAAAFAALAVLLFTRTPDTVTLRGSSGLELSLFVSRDRGEALPYDGSAPLFPGDVLRFAASTSSRCWATVMNADERGRIQRYVPSVEIEAGASHVLPGSIELDDFVGRETLLLLCSEQRLEEIEIERAIEAAHRRGGIVAIEQLDLDARVDGVLIHKEAR